MINTFWENSCTNLHKNNYQQKLSTINKSITLIRGKKKLTNSSQFESMDYHYEPWNKHEAHRWCT
jgi:hypothetical protein